MRKRLTDDDREMIVEALKLARRDDLNQLDFSGSIENQVEAEEEEVRIEKKYQAVIDKVRPKVKPAK